MEQATFITLTEERYRENLEQAARLGAHQALRLAGLPIKEWYTRTEMQRRHGKHLITEMIRDHKLTPHQLPPVGNEIRRTVYSETELLSQIL